MKISLPLVLNCILASSVSSFSSSSFPAVKNRKQFVGKMTAMEDATDMLVTSVDITETIRKESLVEYDIVMDHFMFELGNDMVFLQNQKEVSTYINDNFDAILFDCDGVLYRGTDPIPDAAKSLQSLIKSGKKVLFCTNNAGYNRMQLRDKLANILDCPELKEEQMVSSSYSAAKYLEKSLDENGLSMKDANVHVIGTQGLCDEISSFGARVTGGPDSDDVPCSMSREELAGYSFAKEENQGEVHAIVVGLDNEFNYRKLCIANVLLQRHPDAILVATNEDAFDLVGSDSRHLPGNGSLVGAIEACSQRKAVNVGKPSKILAELLREEHDLDPSRTLFVGDRLDTDIKFGKDGGMKSALVLTGCTTSSKLVELGVGTDDEPLPNIIFPHMGMMGLE